MGTPSRFIQSCWGQASDTVPVWFMRQAGRYQESYRELRRHHPFMDLATNPELCVDVTCKPVEELGVDAAILFSDIMVPLAPMGIDFTIKESVGPVIVNSVRSMADVLALHVVRPERDLPYVMEAVHGITERLGETPLIGFAGGPFTLASYIVEGGPSKNYLHTKRMMWTAPDVWAALMNALVDVVSAHLTAQVTAGARAIQIFDSWIGALTPDDYERWVLPYMVEIFKRLAPLGVPRIYFGVGTGSLLELMVSAGPDVLGVDWRVPMVEARRRVGPKISLQGNLDPVRVTAGYDALVPPTEELLQSMRGDPGYIFNLGHGVLPMTEPIVLKELVDLVHRQGQRGQAS